MRRQQHAQKVTAHARKRLVVKAGAKPADILNQYKEFLAVEERRLKMAHQRGASGRAASIILEELDRYRAAPGQGG